jgi:hypothetical protein
MSQYDPLTWVALQRAAFEPAPHFVTGLSQTDPPDPHAPPTAQAMARLQGALGETRNALGDLAARLAIVLRPDSPQAPGGSAEKPPAPPRSPLCDGLHGLASEAEGLYLRIRDLADRLDV